MGKNDVAVNVAYGTTKKKYKVLVTKSGSLGTLTLTSVVGEEIGDTKITIAETIAAGLHYVYKTDASTAPAVDLDDKLTTDDGWAEWDGEADITAENEHEITVAAVDYVGRAKAAGSKTIVARTE